MVLIVNYKEMENEKMREKAMKILAVILTITVTLSSLSVRAQAASSSTGSGKYVSDVYFAYGKTEEEAVQWLKDNGWEPIKGSNDFNAGKNSSLDDPLAVAMGIKRTSNVDEAITDMAVMNMKGGYSFPDYEDLLNQRKGEIDEFINAFFPVLKEYRANYNGKGSEAGKMRADIAFELLNRFTDGGKDEEYAQNDTGLPIGDLLLKETRQEGNDAGGDLQQILLEGSGGAVILIEQMLALGADDNKDSWLDRLESLSGDGLISNLEKYVPEAAGQNVSASVATQYLNQYFGDTAKYLADQWELVNSDLQWYESYCTANSLWQKDGENEKTYQSRVTKYFDNLKKTNPDAYAADYKSFVDDAYLYALVYDVQYSGEWGDTLGDFFNPADGTYDTPDDFLPFAAALSEGQRAAASLVSLRNLLFMGVSDSEGIALAQADITSNVSTAKPVSVYFGVNRSIFRNGVAMTSAAEMAEAMGNGHVYDLLYGNNRTYTIATYAAAGVGLIAVIAGSVMASKGYVQADIGNIELFTDYNIAQANVTKMKDAGEVVDEVIQQSADDARAAWQKTVNYKANGLGWVGRGVLALGAVLMIGAAVYNGYRFYQYYQKTFTPIPQMIVDEADIVEYYTDEAGNSQRSITFDQYAYYDVAKCNRQEVGNIGDWQDGVESYAEWGCGDAVDLNGDFGQEWLALYTIKNTAKGNPILADSLTLQYGSSEVPKGCTQKLHFFTMTNAVDLGDMAYSYNNEKGGVYFFWNSDEKATSNAVASVFTGGQLALAGVGGLVLGLLISTPLILMKRKKKTEETA